MSTLKSNSSILRLHSIALAVGAALVGGALVGCGGGGGDVAIEAPSGGLPSQSGTLMMTSGGALDVVGVASTQDNLIKSVVWSITPKAGSQMNALVATNGDCLTVAKQDQVLPASALPRTGGSTWRCTLSLKALTVLSEQQYTLNYTSVDDLGNSRVSQTILIVKPLADTGTPGGTPIVGREAGGDFTVASGQQIPLNCAGTGRQAPYTYEWRVEDNANLPLRLDTYTSGQSSLVAPVVAADTKIVLVCKTTDSLGQVVQSPVAVTVKKSVPETLTLTVAGRINGRPTVSPGQIVEVSALASWYGANGAPAKAPTPAVSFSWSIAEGSAAGATLLSGQGESTQLVVPKGAVDGQKITLVLTASSPYPGTPPVSQTLTLLVDPFGLGELIAEPLVQTVDSGKSVKVAIKTATPPTAGERELFYKWSVVQGPAIELSGANASTVGFAAPIVASPSNVRLKVQVGYRPITEAYEGVYSEVVSVGVNPLALGSRSINFTPSALQTESGSLASIRAQVAGTAFTSGTYYQWSIVEGPAGLTLSGAGSDTVGFIVPKVEQSTRAILRLSVSDKPIDTANPGIYADQVVVGIEPARRAITFDPSIVQVEVGGVATIKGVITGNAPASATYYQWTVVEGPAGIVLSGANSPTVSFVAPSVLEASRAVLRLSVSDRPIDAANPGLFADQVVVAIEPSRLLSLLINPTAQTLTSGQSFVANANTQLLPNQSGRPLYYKWSVQGGPGVVLGGDTTSAVGFVAPVVAVPTPMTLRVELSFEPITAQAPAPYVGQSSIVVNPPTALSSGIEFTPGAQSVASGAPVSIKGTVSGTNFAAGKYYRWSIIQGPVVPLGAAGSSEVSFFAPTVAAPTTMVLLLEVSGRPIDAANPAVYADQVIVNVTP